MSTPEYDLAIVGAGASGLIAADFAVQLGARTALLDKGPIGGDCTWSGCVPSKSLIKAGDCGPSCANRVALRNWCERARSGHDPGASLSSRHHPTNL